MSIRDVAKIIIDAIESLTNIVDDESLSAEDKAHIYVKSIDDLKFAVTALIFFDMLEQKRQDDK